MLWDFSDDRPLYLQIIEQIKLGIVSGVFPSGSRLPSVRDLAAQAVVNPNTMQKALGELEREGLVFTQRTMGRFITEDQKMVEHIKKELAEEQIKAFLDKMKALGFEKDEIIELLAARNTQKEEN